MTKNRTRTPVYLDPGMHPGLEVKGLKHVYNKSMGYGTLQLMNNVLFHKYVLGYRLPID